jgi:glutamate-1-semialdehyde 2,1-aminomutase
VSAAAGIATLRLAATGEPQNLADRAAASLREALSSAFAQAGVAGCAYGESSSFNLLFGYDSPAGLDIAVLGNAVPRHLSAALHCAMLSRGVHLFHGGGFLSATHTDREVDLTATAFAAALKQLQSEGLL